MKFQNPSKHSLKVMLGTKMCDDFLTKEHNPRKGRNIDKKNKICVNYFFTRNPYMKFQNPSKHGSKVILGTKKA